MSSFSIKWLLLAVAYVAICIVALINANSYWRQGFESAALLCLLSALLGTILSRGRRRSFWTGWLIFGGAWFLLVIGLFGISQRWRPRLITTGLNALHGQIFKPTIEMFPHKDVNPAIERSNSLEGDIRTLPDGRHQVVYVRPAQSAFSAVGNAVFCIPFALLGGVIGRWFWHKRETDRD
jgi:hypothetical protein